MAEQAARAASDLQRYAEAMGWPNGWETCLRIEERWSLDGYPPSIVCDVLNRLANGEDRDDAESAALACAEARP